MKPKRQIKLGLDFESWYDDDLGVGLYSSLRGGILHKFHSYTMNLIGSVIEKFKYLS